ncbi:hypothetical protein [Salisaeta longa]|uniref:hypothetical protein n=1 Tax=Salisaeta longa TaxID=503170 RepID=UPI0012F760AC|nr:hypothetical protein [Salisaeta longa]
MAVALLLGGWLATPAARAQRPSTPDSAMAWHEAAWTPMLVRNGLQFYYLFYPRADNHHNGVVIKLQNTNAYPVRYRFEVIFRAANGTERSAVATGRVGAHRLKTGDASGLFWIPFAGTNHTIRTIGLRGYRVVPVDSLTTNR